MAGGVWSARLWRWQPRIVALVWAIYAALTSAAYSNVRPEQLDVPSTILPVALWEAWAAAAVMLVLGALVPPGAGPLAQRIARVLRVGGLALIAALLAMWTVAYFGYGERGWVSGKNYFMLLFAAAASAILAGKDGGEPWARKSPSVSSPH